MSKFKNTPFFSEPRIFFLMIADSVYGTVVHKALN